MRASKAALCAVLLLAAGAALAAPKPTERSKQKAAAEASRSTIAQKLATLKRDISRTESAKESAADTLAESEQAISNANRSLRDLATEQNDTNVHLRELGAAQDKLVKTIDAQKKQLARLLREHYVAGNEDRIKLLLSGDNPNRINRDLQLMAYVSQAQAKLLASLRGNLAAIEANQQEAQNAKDELEEIAQEEREQKAVLEQEKTRRAALLGTLSQRLAVQRKEVGKMEADQQRMDGLVNRLAALIKQEAEAAAAEKKRQEAVAAAKARADAEARLQARARAQAEHERLAREAAKSGARLPPFKPVPIDDVEAPLAQHAPEARPKAADITLAPAALEGAFASLRGQMRAPVPGKLAIKFGSKLGEGRWKGVFIKAEEGSDVRVVAGGRVIYADWVRGLGNMIIVDHGSGYWSVYAYNQSLLKRAGDAVKAGEAIASSGKTGGQEESGLYFEMRHNTLPFDPVGWVKF
ncbi:MAG: peptidoglycan DD-metalloendopeptidase family protein [Pseudomonadota bacterium]